VKTRNSTPTRSLHEFATVSMDTGVHVQVISGHTRERIEPAVQRALAWFDMVERVCTRFDPNSEVMRLLQHVGQPVQVSTLLLEAAGFALDLGDLTEGAFDPTVGATLEQLGHATNYRTGEVVKSNVDAALGSFRDVRLDRQAATITLGRPLVLDLNAVAKGLAIDLAMQALGQYPDVCLEAGGDLFVRGHNLDGEPWRVGIQHPRADGMLARTLRVSNAAVCTSGDYERAGHVLDARTRTAVTDLASVSVVAPTAMAADGLSTAAMVLGRDRGLELIASQGAAAILITPDGAITTAGDLDIEELA
jgi:thiamine biosynthesis lipoprotein